MMTPVHRWSRLVSVASACALLAWACGTTTPSSSLPSNVSGVISGATGLGSTPTTGSPQSGAAPPANGGPAASASGGSPATSGGGDEVTVSAGGTPFQTVFVSAGSSGSSAVASGVGAGLARAETIASGFYEISLPSAVTTLAIGLTYASNLPASGFDLLIQVANGTSVGPVAILHKSVTTGNFVEVTGIVFENDSQRLAGAPFPVNPVAGAVVSTSLDSHTATTDAAGGFDLQTGTTATTSSQCYTITITFPGLPTYSVHGLWGTQATNQVFVMSPPMPSQIQSCGSP
jgi:hypothetical protein